MIIVLRHHRNVKNLYFFKLKTRMFVCHLQTCRLPLIVSGFLREKRIEISEILFAETFHKYKIICSGFFLAK